MRARTKAIALTGAIVLLAGGFVPSVRAATPDTSTVDVCLGPAAEASPDTPEWYARESQNVFCAQHRILDKAQHPALGLAVDPESDLDPNTDPNDTSSRLSARDRYRVPTHHGDRFRYRAERVTNRSDAVVDVELYAPCADCAVLPDGLHSHPAPYPAVIVVPGGGSVPGAPEGNSNPGAPKELYRWVAQGLAEAGYMTALLDITSAHLEDAQDVLDWVLATPSEPTAVGEHNPWWAEVDRDHIGIAGHSGGGATASRLGFLDRRFDAIVSYDRSTRYDLPDNDRDIRTPALFFVGDYGIGVTPHRTAPNPDGNKVDSFLRLRRLGVDTMHLALRAASHLDWSPPLAPAGNRYAEAVSLYYTLAWFDRYLKGAIDPDIAADAFARLTATEFDNSADVHNISQGLFDPALAAAAAAEGDLYGGNVPYTINGRRIADRLSFYFPSRCFITAPTGSSNQHRHQGQARRVASDDMRATGCV